MTDRTDSKKDNKLSNKQYISNPNQTDNSEDLIDLKDLWIGLIRKKKWLFLSAGSIFLGTLIFTSYLRIFKPVFRGSFTILISDPMTPSVKTNNNFDIQKLIDEEKKLIYNKSWNKLEQGLKINRFNIFIDELKDKYDLNNIQKMQLSELLIKSCEKNKLNKNSQIIYDIENAKIIDIKILEFNEKNKTFSLNFPEQKHKIKNKSKSNIERILR